VSDGDGGGRGDRGRGCCAVASLVLPTASADTLEQALAYAYVNNPQINSQRAVVRAIDEGVRPRSLVTGPGWR